LYGAGLASNTQVLDAIALRVAAANNRDDAAMDFELARLRLARATGEL
jgi:outer membrane protein TolC